MCRYRYERGGRMDRRGLKKYCIKGVGEPKSWGLGKSISRRDLAKKDKL